MSVINFDDKKSRDAALAQLTELLKHPGWNLVVAVVRENIEIVKGHILNGFENETKESIDRLRDNLKLHEEFINTPKMLIEKLNPVEPSLINEDDPYFSEIKDGKLI